MTTHMGARTKTGSRRSVTVAVTLAGAAWVLAACGGSAEANGTADGEGGGEAFARVINVETTVVTPRAFTEVIRLPGTVEANRDVVVSAEESGVVREILAEKGVRIGEGRPIAKIDDRVLTSQVRQAEAQAALARETWERRKRLWEEEGVGSELAYLEARYAAEQAAANLQTLRERLDRTVVRAPIAGILDERRIEVGTMVSPGTPVARIVDMDPVKINAGVPERFAADVSRGSSATVTFDVMEGPAFEARVSYVGAAVNPNNRTFPVELTLPNPGHAIKPEMVANVELTRRTLADAVVVPQEALVRVEDGYVVFVVESEGGEEVARARTVTIGPAQRDEVVVTSGLDPGGRLVVVGQKLVADGDRVRVVEER